MMHVSFRCLRFRMLESEKTMAAKCAYVEKVGAVYYVRKRIPRAWMGRVGGDVLRLSLRTKDRVQALKWGLEALAVFEDLLSMTPEDALRQLTRRLLDEQMLRPEEMTGADLTRRRALGSVGGKIIKRARMDLGLGEHLDALYQELVHFNHATVQGEAVYDRISTDDARDRAAGAGNPDLSGFDAVLEALAPKATNAKAPQPATVVEPAAVRVAKRTEAAAPSPVYTLRYLMNDYFNRTGKHTGSDNRSNIERAVKLFEDLCPEVKNLAAPDIPLSLWDQLYEFAQEIPRLQGKTSPANLVAFTRQKRAKGEDYPKLAAGTLNSNYLGAITRLIRHGNNRRLFSWQAPTMVIAERKRATKARSRVPFSSEEITAITSCPVYVGSASRHLRYSPGEQIFADDHIYWAPLISMHTGMRVTEIGMLRPEQLQTWFGRPTLVLEVDEQDASAAGEEGYKTGNALRRVAIHSQLIDIGLLDFWNRQNSLGHKGLFPAWAEHIKGGKDGRTEVHFEADFFNAHRLQWGVPPHRKSKVTFHSLRGFFIQACHDAKLDAYTILKMVGHDEDTKAKTSEVHRGYLSQDLTADEVNEIDKVKVPLGSVTSFADWLKR